MTQDAPTGINRLAASRRLTTKALRAAAITAIAAYAAALAGLTALLVTMPVTMSPDFLHAAYLTMLLLAALTLAVTVYVLAAILLMRDNEAMLRRGAAAIDTMTAELRFFMKLVDMAELLGATLEPLRSQAQVVLRQDLDDLAVATRDYPDAGHLVDELRMRILGEGPS